MPEKKPTLVLAEEKAMSDDKRRRRKTSRSPPPPSFLPDYPDDGPESGPAVERGALRTVEMRFVLKVSRRQVLAFTNYETTVS